jgi:hypothetical protein
MLYGTTSTWALIVSVSFLAEILTGPAAKPFGAGFFQLID